MSKQIMLLTALLLTAKLTLAEESKKELTYYEKSQIAWAIKVLNQYEVIKSENNQCLEYDKSILETLKEAGMINYGKTQLATICIDPTE
ncbi:MAG: hypothetical protein KDD45_12545 [Bdellovibrionales bacterium]|nr:hypothetical protein [Bdellovibrionales bacterium]